LPDRIVEKAEARQSALLTAQARFYIGRSLKDVGNKF